MSIITATYNSERTILRSIRSIADQDYKNIEHLLIDGQSTDSTLKIIAESKLASTVVVSEQDFGIYDALNKGIRLATGDIIGFLHSDDVFSDSSVLEKVVSCFEAGNDIVYSDLAYVGTQSGNTVRLWRSGEFKPYKLQFGWMPPHPTFYCRRQVYQTRVHNPRFRISGDYELMLSILVRKHIKIGYLPSVTVKMQLGGKSNKGLGNLLRKTYEDIQALRSVGIFPYFAVLMKNLSKIPQFFRR